MINGSFDHFPGEGGGLSITFRTGRLNLFKRSRSSWASSRSCALTFLFFCVVVSDEFFWHRTLDFRALAVCSDEELSLGSFQFL